MGKCPCGERNSPDPNCDMCDAHKCDPDTGWGGYTNRFTGKYYEAWETEPEHNPFGELDDEDYEDSDTLGYG